MFDDDALPPTLLNLENKGGGCECVIGCHHQQPRLSHRGPVPSTNVLSNWTATGVIGVSAVSPGTVKRDARGHRNYAD